MWRLPLAVEESRCEDRTLIDFRHGPARSIGIELRDSQMRRGRKRVGRIAGPDLSCDNGHEILADMLLQQPECNGGCFVLDAWELVVSLYLFGSIRSRAAHVVSRGGVVVIFHLVDGYKIELQPCREIGWILFSPAS